MLALLLFMVIVMPLVLLWTFALIDLFIRKDIGMAKVIWLIVIIVLPVLGSIIYLLVPANRPGHGRGVGRRDSSMTTALSLR